MRVSERQKYWIANRRIEKGRTDNVGTLDILSTQKKINKLKDDPIGLVRSLKIKGDISELKTFKDNIDFSKGFLSVTESAISNIHEELQRAQELALAMSNDTYGSVNREIAGKEIKEIISRIIQVSNSKYGSKFIFSGFRNTFPSLDQHGNFLGDDGQIFIQIGHGRYKSINIPGRELFEADTNEKNQGHYNLLDALELLLQGLSNNEKYAIQKSVDEISYQMDKVASFQSSVGAKWNAMEDAEEQIDFTEVQKKANLSKIEDADIFQATSDFKRTEAVLQSTLMASNKMLQPSLLNFIQ